MTNCEHCDLEFSESDLEKIGQAIFWVQIPKSGKSLPWMLCPECNEMIQPLLAIGARE